MGATVVTETVLRVEDAEQRLVVVVAGAPEGGFFEMQSSLLHLLPEHVAVQYMLMLEHQDWYLAHWRLAGQPEERKQSAIWSIHSATAILQVGLSENTGRGLEHQFPH